MNQDIVMTILNQFGGNMAMAMIGGKPMIKDEYTLVIQWKCQAENGAKKVEIRLTPMDEYEVTFFTIHGREVSKFDGVYAEDLQNLFEGQTKLYLHF
jgi:hypothetical protein